MATASKKVNLYPFNGDECSQFICKAFDAKKNRNPKYSIRAFAKYLEIDHSQMSKFLKGEAGLSSNSIFHCLQKLNAPRSLIEQATKRLQKALHFSKISDDEFEYISDWAHFAILELMTINGFELSAVNVHKQLKLPLKRAQECIDRLVKLGFIEHKRNKYTLRRVNNTWYPSDTTNEVKIQSQLNLLKASQDSLMQDAFEERDHSSVILAVNRSEIPTIKEVIKDARRQLTKIIQKNTNFEDVYCLQLSFFPMRERER